MNSSGSPTSRQLTLDHQEVLNQLQRRAGLIFPATRINEVAAVMEKAASSSKLTLEEYARNLTIDNVLFDHLCSQVTIAETYFFRDPKQFDFVKYHVIPAWLASRSKEGADAHTKSAPFLAWSAGCASGEEAYSLAILFEQAGLSADARVTATDICREALARADRAKYGPWSLRTSDQKFCHSYFDYKDSLFGLKDQYTSAVRFAYLNLVDDIVSFKTLGLGNLDLIFCRNVLIYFDSRAISKVIKTFNSLLKPGGYLVLGPSDPSPQQYADFEVMVCEWGVFYKKGDGSKPVGSVATASSAELPKLPPINDSSISSNSLRKYQPVNKLTPPTPGKERSPAETMKLAESAFTHGQYEKAFKLTGVILEDPAAAILHIKSLSNFSGPAAAEKVLKKLVQQHASNFHLQYLYGHILLELGLLSQAQTALKACLFLDSQATMAHFSLGLVQKQLADIAGARRSFRNVQELCKNRPDDEIVPYGDGERVRFVASHAAAELESLAGS